MSDIASGGGGWGRGIQIGDVFSTSVQVFLRRLPVLLALALLCQAPVFAYLWGSLQNVYDPSRWVYVLGGGESWSLRLDLRGAGSSILGGLAALVANGMILYVVRQTLGGQPASFGRALQVALQSLVTIIIISIIVGILITLGLLLLIIPGLIIMCVYYVAIPACVAEGGGAAAGMSRSAELTSGYRGHIFGILILLLILAWAFDALVIGSVVSGLAPATALFALPVLYTIAVAFAAVVNGVVYCRLRWGHAVPAEAGN